MSNFKANIRDKHKDNIQIIKDFITAKNLELDTQTKEYLNLVNDNTIDIANILLQTNMPMKKKLVTLLRQAQKWDKENTSNENENKKEADRNIEKITENDIEIYIHGCPKGYKQARGKSNSGDLGERGYFSRLYDNTIKHTRLYAKDMGDGSTEYTITKPSLEYSSEKDIGRHGGYAGISIILKNGYRIYKSGKLPDSSYIRDYSNTDHPVKQIMDSLFTVYLVEYFKLFKQTERGLEWTINDSSIHNERVRKIISTIKTDIEKHFNKTGCIEKIDNK